MEGRPKDRFARLARIARKMGAAVPMMEGGYQISSKLPECGGSVQELLKHYNGTRITRILSMKTGLNAF